ncbi:MAG: protease SohB [Gammaproteobacteria bacterium]|nr:protease SohB [Gammaproteobacteria bacterium]
MWSDFFFEFGIFFAEVLSVILLITIAVLFIFFVISRSQQTMDGQIEIKNLNQKYNQMRLILNSVLLSKKEYKKNIKQYKSDIKKDKKTSADDTRNRLFVINFKGDIRASQVTSLREEITAILGVARKGDEVLVKLESGGGTVHGYGLAASQLKRLRDKNIRLTIAVDKVAASGGYMMACVGNSIIAAPFAIIGSIGVLAQLPNFNRLLKKHNIDFEQISAGKHKRSLTLFGENTEEDREKLRQELEDTHELFKQFIKENRDGVDIDLISTGEHWYGQRALDLNLVDRIQTSDDYINDVSESFDIYEIEYTRKKPVMEKVFGSAVNLFKPDEI